MRRILLLVTLASMLAAAMALSGVAQAAPISDKADAQCLNLTIKTLGPGFNPSNYTFIGGTEVNDNFSNPTQATAGPDVFCGFGGIDSIQTLDEGDIFLGGAGNDQVGINEGTFYGQEGIEFVFVNNGTFYGGAGDEIVIDTNTGTVFGGAGNDFVFFNKGTFYGEEGKDGVQVNSGTFDGGDGTEDFVVTDNGGITSNVP